MMILKFVCVLGVAFSQFAYSSDVESEVAKKQKPVSDDGVGAAFNEIRSFMGNDVKGLIVKTKTKDDFTKAELRTVTKDVETDAGLADAFGAAKQGKIASDDDVANGSVENGVYYFTQPGSIYLNLYNNYRVLPIYNDFYYRNTWYDNNFSYYNWTYYYNNYYYNLTNHYVNNYYVGGYYYYYYPIIYY